VNNTWIRIQIQSKNFLWFLCKLDDGYRPKTHADHSLEWLYSSMVNLTEMEQYVAIQEITNNVCLWTNNKSPKPDEFTGEFYKAFKDIFSYQIFFTYFSYYISASITSFPLNSSHIILILTKEDALKSQEFNPISLVHAVQFFFSKILVNRLRNRMKDLVYVSQLIFLKVR
jgi:hypothetical protein